jgi:methylase of polypeptide subunit release factors
MAINKSLIIKYKKNTFIPTGTSDLLVESIKKKLKIRGKVLDLGAGSGYVGLKLLNLFKDKFNLFASDIGKSSTQIIKSNAKINKKKVIVKTGSLFKPWKSYKFDFIINDVSGISEDVANISPWFKNVSCKSGKDGTKLTVQIIKESKNFLNKKGIICFPVLSFAKENKILESAKKQFRYIKKIGYKEWLLPKEMISKILILENLKKKGYINFKRKFGLIVWTTKIYIAYN